MFQQVQGICSTKAQDQHGHHSGCYDHQRTQFDQEPAAATRPGHAPDAQRPAVVLRNEGARGGDSTTKLIHLVVATAANVADSRVLGDLLHGDETRVWGDQAYRGQTDVLRRQAPARWISRTNATDSRASSTKPCA
jgi:hypothetical protein